MLELEVGLVGVLALDLFSYIEVDITPVVAILMGRGLLTIPTPGPARILTTLDPGVSTPPLLIALGDRPAILS